MIPAEALSELLAAVTGSPFKLDSITQIAGGSPWQAMRIDNARTGNPRQVLAKMGEVEHLPVFLAEKDGLDRLRAADTSLRVPNVIACRELEEHALLLLEWIDLVPLAIGGVASAAALGEGLAQLHRTTSDRFGLDTDNFIGVSPQFNKPDGDWVSFWQHQRLMPQLQMAKKNRYPSKLIGRGERLMADCGAFFSSHRPVASLLHGDLWSGNAAADTDGRPVLFDPAVYHGDREADIAMTELFGRYPKDFYSAYDNAFPLDADYPVRKNFYNLYHLLNHANIFSGDYVLQTEKMIEALLAEL